MGKLKQLISWLIYGFIFLLPLQTRWIYRPGELNGVEWEYGAFSLYATEILLGIIVILAIIYVLCFLKGQSFVQFKIMLSKQSKKLVLLIALVLLVMLNCLFAYNQEIAFYKLEQIIAATALFFVIILIKLDFNKIAWSFALSGFVQGAMAILQFIEQKIAANKWLGLAEQLPQTLGVPVVQISDERWLRPFGSFPHPNILAGFLVISLICAVGLFLLNSRREIGKWLLAIMAVDFLALLTALSRASFIAIAAGVVLLAIFVRKDRELTKKIVKIVLIFIFIFTVFAISYPKLIMSRALSESRVENLSNVSRIEQYIEWRQIVKDKWLFGAGLGNYTLALAKLKPNLPAWSYQPIHNTYLLIIAELGLVGLMVCLLFIVYLASIFWKLVKSVATIPLICFTCLVCLACLAFFDHYLWNFWSGIMISSIVLAQYLVKQ